MQSTAQTANSLEREPSNASALYSQEDVIAAKHFSFRNYNLHIILNSSGSQILINPTVIVSF